VIIVLVKYI